MTIEEYYNAAVEEDCWSLKLVIEFFVINKQELDMTASGDDLRACMDRYENLNSQLLAYWEGRRNQ